MYIAVASVIIAFLGFVASYPSFDCISQNKINIVYNELKSNTQQKRLSLRKELEICDKDEEYTFIKPIQVLVDEQNNIYVLDRSDRNIKKFDARGRYIMTIGKPGIGPTELDGIESMSVFKNEIFVWCPGKADMVIFDLNGKYLRTSRLHLLIHQVKIDPRGNIYGTIRSSDGGQELVKLDNMLKVVKTIDKRPWETPAFFGITLMYTITKDGLIIVGNPEKYDKYEIKIFNMEGELIQLIRKQYKAVPIPKDEMEYIRKNNPLNWGIPEHRMPFIMLYASSLGNIFVNTYDRFLGDKKKYFDVYDREGKYLAAVTLNYFDNCFLDYERLYTIEENEEGLPTVRVYKTVWH